MRCGDATWWRFNTPSQDQDRHTARTSHSTHALVQLFVLCAVELPPSPSHSPSHSPQVYTDYVRNLVNNGLDVAQNHRDYLGGAITDGTTVAVTAAAPERGPGTTTATFFFITISRCPYRPTQHHRTRRTKHVWMRHVCCVIYSAPGVIGSRLALIGACNPMVYPMRCD